MYEFISYTDFNSNSTVCAYVTVNQYRKDKIQCNESFRIFFIDWKDIEKLDLMHKTAN